MKNDLPEEINDALRQLISSEKSDNYGKKIQYFIDGLEELDDCLTEYPGLKEKINNYKLSYTRSLLTNLQQNRPDIPPDSWVDLLFKVIIKERDITRKLVIENPESKEYIEEFVGLWADTTPSNIKKLLDDVLYKLDEEK